MKHARTRKNRLLTEDQKRFISKNWIVLSDVDIAKYLGTTRDAVRKMRSFMGLNRQDLKDKTPNIPVVIWMPRDSYEEYSKDRDAILIEEL